jgi:4-aminobutyrate aminotransferase-like enzyme
VGQARSLGLLMGVSFRHPEGGKDHWMSRGVRSFMLRNGAYPICDGEEVTVRMYPALNMEESVLREALEIMEAGIVQVSRHGHAEGDYPTYPTGDYGA